MMHNDENEITDIKAYLDTQERKDYLQFLTCGSVDDGKSTLIGRLLYDSKLIYDDQLAAIESDSRKFGTQDKKIDLALLVDGLAAEREQGITIDVAYRFFSTDKRKFIVADTPGHEQYTRNMATGASSADVAVVLIDARHGVQTQTRRHSFIASLLGIQHIVVAVNKMDLVDFSESVFIRIKEDYKEFSNTLDFSTVTFIPICALDGDNVTKSSTRCSWYKGKTLLSFLENIDISHTNYAAAFRFPVQWVNRPNADFRGFSGTIASGKVHPNDEVIVVPSGKRSRVKTISTYSGTLGSAVENQAITLTLEDEIDVSRGDVICHATTAAAQSDQLVAHILCMSEHKLFPGRQYILKTNNQSVPAEITELKHKIDVNSFAQVAGKTLDLNEVGVCNISLGRVIAFDPYKENRHMGSFILIDKFSNATVAAGMLDFSLRRAHNVVWQNLEIDKKARATQKLQKPVALWFTGLSGAGKSTIANLVEKCLFDRGRHTYILDGDNIRHGLNKDLGFQDADRIENIRRVSETARLMVDAGLITLVSFISPFRAERQMARTLLGEGQFIEIYIDTPLAIAEQRDVKGLYKKARSGVIQNFTGIDSEYQAPENPEISLDTVALSPEEAAAQIITYLEKNGYLEV